MCAEEFNYWAVKFFLVAVVNRSIIPAPIHRNPSRNRV